MPYVIKAGLVALAALAVFCVVQFVRGKLARNVKDANSAVAGVENQAMGVVDAVKKAV